MTTKDGVIEEVELDRAMLVALLKTYVAVREERDVHDKHLKRMSELLKGYLEAHPGEELWDGEAEIVGKLQTRTGSEGYDVYNMPPEMVAKLHQANALSVDVKLLRALSGKSALPEDVKPYRVPGGETTALIVQRGK